MAKQSRRERARTPKPPKTGKPPLSKYARKVYGEPEPEAAKPRARGMVATGDGSHVLDHMTPEERADWAEIGRRTAGGF